MAEHFSAGAVELTGVTRSGLQAEEPELWM